MSEQSLILRITTDPKHFGGKPIIRGHCLAVEHVLGMLHADTKHYGTSVCKRHGVLFFKTFWQRAYHPRGISPAS